MCNRYSLGKRNELIESRVFGTVEFDFEPRYNISPGQCAPVVLAEEGRLVCREMQWGWQGDYGLIPNVQSEASAMKIYEQALKKRRCLIPADGYYQWKDGQPYRIVRATRSILWLAGIWENNAFAIFTKPAVGFLLKIGDREPVIIGKSKIDWWFMAPLWVLNGVGGLTAQGFKELTLETYPVTPLMSNVHFESPQCIEPLETNVAPLDIDHLDYCWREISDSPPEPMDVMLLFSDEEVADGEWDGENWTCKEYKNIKPLKWRMPLHLETY